METFGLTPIEGMAAGLPVLHLTENGYKSTVRQNTDGFRVKTISSILVMVTIWLTII